MTAAFQTSSQTADIALEAKVIGAILAHPTLYGQAAHLGEEVFHDAAHAAIWQAIRSSSAAGRPLAPTAIYLAHTSALDPHGGLDILSGLSSRGDALATSFPEAVDRLHTLALWRRITLISARLASAVQTREKRPEDVIHGLGKLAGDLLAGGRETAERKSQTARRAVERARQRRPIVTTGINSLDYLMQGGLQPGRLVGIGGVYGRGKTILLGSISENLNNHNEPHLFISLETDPVDIEIRNCARQISLNASTLYDHTDPEHTVFTDMAENYLGSINDNVLYEYAPGASMDDIHRMILRARSRHGIRGVIIDYWQLIRGRERGQNEEAHLRHCADRLAALMRQEDIWGLITAQVDENGRLKTSDALLTAASLFVRLVRDENETAAFFRTEKSNYTRYADTGTESMPGMVFDPAGPHFRNTEPNDIADLAREQANDLGI